MSIIKESMTVHAPGLSRGVTLGFWERKEDSVFFRVSKADPRIIRVLTGHGVGSERVLATTDIIEKLSMLRNKKREELIDHAVAPRGGRMEDLGLGDEDIPVPPKRRRAVAAGIPDAMTIAAPSLDGVVKGLDMKVLVGVRNQALWVELISANVDYLRAYINGQITLGNIHKNAVKEKLDGDAYDEDGEQVSLATDGAPPASPDIEGDKHIDNMGIEDLAI